MVEFVSSDDWDLCKQQFKATTFIGKEPVVKPWNPRSKTGAAVWQAEVDQYGEKGYTAVTALISK